ncbi:MAG TPA: class I SAM-dependent methyltransferase [Acidimicrobiia bacterium]|nr:class I SAM-dependent methyltransferase [Acidimicrobiia bacterium]
MATSSDAHGHHDWHSAEYVDGWITNDVTRDTQRKPVLRRVAALLPFERDAEVRILDIGGGYGMLTREVLEELPQSRVVLHDFSRPMIEQARARLGPLLDRVEFVQADLRDPAWVDAVGGPFDAVVSSIAIHNVRDPERIRAIFGEIQRLVSTGGCFADLDLVFPGTLELDTQLEWLEDAGFKDVACAFEFEHQALLIGFN